ncbi:MarR family transcriptional regulator [Nonomuraea sp. NPDC049649]|uniref:MarR family winged helix-turn-helix transcriptional regulator n=1 Tax=Nonomuraea sp. NPDC049649 TaxID=3155776 RepID=UPI00344AAA11
MTSRHRRHIAYRRLHESVVELTGLLNMPQRDEALMAEAGIDLDQTLFKLIIGIRQLGPIGVVELAERIGRDHTTISRQVAKLAELGLVERRPSPEDRRVKEAVITSAGRRVTDALDEARQRILDSAFAEWSDRDLVQFEQLLRRCVDDMHAMHAAAKEKSG